MKVLPRSHDHVYKKIVTKSYVLKMLARVEVEIDDLVALDFSNSSDGSEHAFLYKYTTLELSKKNSISSEEYVLGRRRFTTKD